MLLHSPTQVYNLLHSTLLIFVTLHIALSSWKPNYVTWEPSSEEMSLLRENPKRRKVELDSSVGKDKHVYKGQYSEQ